MSGFSRPGVAISGVKPLIWPKKAMEKLLEKYEAFERLMDVEEVWRDESLDFAGICALAGADPEELETVLSEELGYLGDELVEVYRKCR